MNVLSIAGSDPSSGAGIQGDIKTYSSLGVYGLSVVTAITSQSTSEFFSVEQVSSKMIKSQLQSILSDVKVDVIKIGMVYSSPIIKAIYSKLKNTRTPIVLDPIFESTTGGILLRSDALPDFKRLLVPLCFAITPNIPEAEKLVKLKIKSRADVKRAAIKIREMGARNVVIKGGHFGGNTVVDYLLDDSGFHEFSGKRIPRKIHGGGCGFSAALAASLSKGSSLMDAVKFAKEYVAKSIENSQRVGRGVFVAKTSNTDQIEKELSDTISNFANLKNAYELIPECQTNFVFSRPNPKSINDILGISGRIVKDGTMVTPVGRLTYGGSRHVASAVFEMTKKFSDIRSAINIKYDTRLIRKATSKNFSVLSYDRTAEPAKTKNKEDSSISWGIKTAIRNATRPPDLIFHKGDFGKEPMILVFGKRPKDVLSKLAKIV
ncbi:MAG: bifunctional hydroxymethylpyrimidine kinase/phosphomethylpyrimidine kinase [Thaumarchaeota archaeon]|nr:bifunctional hydroxymethylpyrimidine kinase/phosphomethylpyrimidine kinase [Nitrososphaerota archaeon]